MYHILMAFQPHLYYFGENQELCVPLESWLGDATKFEGETEAGEV